VKITDVTQTVGLCIVTRDNVLHFYTRMWFAFKQHETTFCKKISK